MKRIELPLILVFVLLSLSACQSPVTPTEAIQPLDTVAPTATPILATSIPTSKLTPAPTPTTENFPIPETRSGQACLVAELPLIEDFGGRIERLAWSPIGEALAYVALDEMHEGALWLAEAPDFDRPQRLTRPASSDSDLVEDEIKVEGYLYWWVNDGWSYDDQCDDSNLTSSRAVCRTYGGGNTNKSSNSNYDG